MKRVLLLIKTYKDFIIFILIYTLLFCTYVRFFGIMLPITVGAVLAAICRPLLRKTEQIFHKPLPGAITLLLAGILTALLTLLVYGIWRETIHIRSGSSYFEFSKLHPKVQAFFSDFQTKLSDGTDDRSLYEMFPSLLPSLSSIFKLLIQLPTVFLFPVLSLLFCSLFLKKQNELITGIQQLIGINSCRRIRHALKLRTSNSSGVLFSYAVIYMTTFAEAVIILYLFRMPHPMITAVLVAVSDIFPVLGPGSVLLPLSIYRLLCGDFVSTIGLFTGWIVITVVRQIIEPKLISKITRTPGSIMLFAFYISLLTGNFWIIPYTALLFFLFPLLRDAKIIKAPNEPGNSFDANQ